MILSLPKSSEDLWNSFNSKTRNRIKKPLREGLSMEMGGVNILDSFYPIFAENMRDLGSPVHSKLWVKSILTFYKNRAVLAVVRLADGTPVAGGIVLGNGKKNVNPMGIIH